jgi:Acyl-CoA reductase (LuxC)
MKVYDIPLLIRGKLFTDQMVEFEARRGELAFRVPDVSAFTEQLPLADPQKLMNLYEISFDDVVQFLDELGKRLRLEVNPYMREAYEVSCVTSGLTPEILYKSYDESIPKMLSADHVREVAENRIGISALEGWTQHRLRGGQIAYTRPLGARSIHVTAGNSPVVAGITTLWNGITRGDAVIKSPSNDPLTSVAIGRTMIDMAPDHPMTQHYSVAYWKGGNAAIESKLYSPENFEKIVAWGGFASMKHITRYLQPGLELIAMDPKLSGTIIGKEAFESDQTMRKVAGLIAMDFGGSNQEGCVNARVISLQSGTDKEGLAKLNRLAEYTYDALQKLPLEVSAPHPSFSPELRQEIAGIRKSPFYRVVGNDGNRGAVIVSQIPEPVEFASLLACRVANFVPFDDIEEALQYITIHTQTIGVYPDSLKRRYRERLALLGGQRIVSVGGHLIFSHSLPHDAMEPLRRLCRWINDEDLPPSGDASSLGW